MDEGSIRERITSLVTQEHELRTRLQEGTLTAEEEHAQLRAAEEELDQCWDLLRQRQARAASGQDPEGAEPRSTSTVEHYLQ